MKKHRSIPFGYTMKNGRLTIEPREAETIRKIFADYAGGATMAELASSLTSMQVPYTERRTDWNKSMIARIIASDRYAGANGFDPIIDPDVFTEICQEKERKTCRKHSRDDTAIGLVKYSIMCHECGQRMVRTQDQRHKESVKWVCGNPQCKTRVAISDELLELRIVDKMNLVIDNLDLLEAEAVYRMERQTTMSKGTAAQELSRMCESGNYSDAQLLGKILSNIQERYMQCPQHQGNSQAEVSTAFQRAEKTEKLNTQLYQKTVQCVLLRPDGSVQLTLKNGNEI